jgi:hypothetical protein
MAARRLVVLLVVLLGLATAIAALAPTPAQRKQSSANAGATGATGSESPRSLINPADKPSLTPSTVRARVEVSNKPPRAIRVEPGDRLVLSVGADFGDDVEIPAFGLTGTMTPYAPATSDLIVLHPGTFPVRTVQSNRVVAYIDSGGARVPAEKAKSKAKAKAGKPRRKDSRSPPTAQAA